jgi:hypothetical protein
MRVSIHREPRFGVLMLAIESAGADFLALERFVGDCKSPRLARQILDECRQAVEKRREWSFHHVAVVVAYSPLTGYVSARPEEQFWEATFPPCSIAAADFLAILVDWLNALPPEAAQANRTTPS